MPIRKDKVIGPATIALALALLVGYVVFSPRHRTPSETNICINNLRQIDGAKQSWAIEHKKSTNDVPAAGDLNPYLRVSLQALKCPAGGQYTVNSVAMEPECSLKNHHLPQIFTD